MNAKSYQFLTNLNWRLKSLKITADIKFKNALMLKILFKTLKIISL